MKKKNTVGKIHETFPKMATLTVPTCSSIQSDQSLCRVFMCVSFSNCRPGSWGQRRLVQGGPGHPLRLHHRAQGHWQVGDHYPYSNTQFDLYLVLGVVKLFSVFPKYLLFKLFVLKQLSHRKMNEHLLWGMSSMSSILLTFPKS